jgi:hypothetical protein
MKGYFFLPFLPCFFFLSFFFAMGHPLSVNRMLTSSQPCIDVDVNRSLPM